MLDGKIAVVTGASRGIGRETAFTFARLGFPILATARNEKDLQSLQAEIKESPEEQALLRALLHPDHFFRSVRGVSWPRYFCTVERARSLLWV